MLRSLLLASLLLFGLGLSACGGGAPACVDRDFDGYGAGCELGPDCDDENASRNTDCVGVPAPDCVADPFATGCPCLPGTLGECFPGDDALEGVGLCVAGQTLCVNRRWGLCAGSIAPRGEICNGLDDDCDGVADDGVLSPCGGCTPGCVGGVWGEGDAPFAAPMSSDETALTQAGWLTLERHDLEQAALWVANSRERSVSRIDPARAIETARYSTFGDDPSRVAVDYHGDAWVLNRQFEGVSSLTKFAGFPERCVDADGSGDVRTSAGPTDVLPEGEDECVLLHVPLGELGGVGRALAVDGNLGLDGISGGDLWVGMHDGMRVLHLDGTTGAEIERVETPGFEPYAAAFDAWGTLWMISKDGLLLRLNRRDSPLTPEIREIPLDCFLTYGLALDDEGRLLITGFSCDQVVRYDPATNRFTRVRTPPSVRGAVVSGGFGWVAHTDGRASVLRMDPFALLETVDLTAAGATPRESIGVAADAFGDIWVVSSEAAELSGGVATRISGDTREVTAQVPVGRRPHTQGDLTGAKRAGRFAPEGTRSHIFTGCPEGDTRWRNVHLAADYGAAGSVEIEVRQAPDEASLSAASFVSLGVAPEQAPPYALTLARGGVVELRVTLRTSARDGAPRLKRVGLEWACSGPD
ncbi:MAG: hypothetical protein GXP55_11070 [Deltaproteobacteria bacterium]|nr:hypothetical protein [Deltaproteobacteria bacterium]